MPSPIGRLLIGVSVILIVLVVPARAADIRPASDEIYQGWLCMYDLRFDEAHRVFGRWREAHADDCLAPASDAAAYLFSELARLGSLEAGLFVDDARFKNREKLSPDPVIKSHFIEEIATADRLADVALQKADNDTTALLVKSLTCGLRANYAALIDKQSLAALSYTKEGRPFAERLLAADPGAFDAYLGPGIENYLLSLKSAPLRFILRITGSETDREKGMEELRRTSLHGHYLEPFAKLLLAVAALRDDKPARAVALLTELHDRFPHNELYARELARIAAGEQ
ncbi:MAG TPA: hypothetical protein VGL24_13140 [Chthoniobacterales bacterium]|jgi:hypothetical protein